MSGTRKVKRPLRHEQAKVTPVTNSSKGRSGHTVNDPASTNTQAPNPSAVPKLAAKTTSGASRSQMANPWQGIQQDRPADDPRMQALRKQMQTNRRLSASLPTPITRDVLSDEESVLDDEFTDDPRVALPPARRPDQYGYGPRKYSDTQTATFRRPTTAHMESELRDRFPGSIERASIDLAYTMLAKEHDRQIAELGGKIYDNVSRGVTIDNGLFDSDSEGSEFSEDFDVPLSPGLIRMQGWLQMSKRLQNLFIILMLITGASVFFGEYEWTRWIVLLMVLIVPSWVLVFGLAERERRERSAFGKVLRSGLQYVRGENPQPLFRRLAE